MRIQLKKLKTREDAEIPQEKKYPSGNILAEGYMFDYSRPEVGQPFIVLIDKKTPIFYTSIIVEILEENKKNIKFKTLNSIYNIIIK